MFVMRQSGAFAGCSDRNQTIRSFGNLPIDDVAKGFFVERAVLERRDQRGKGASKARLGGHGTTSPQVPRSTLHRYRVADGDDSPSISRKKLFAAFLPGSVSKSAAYEIFGYDLSINLA